MSGPIPDPQWRPVPPGGQIAFRVDMQTVGVPTDGSALLAVGNVTWQLTPGEYELTAVMVAEKQKDGPENQWVGRLQLPPFKFVVSKSQGSAK